MNVLYRNPQWFLHKHVNTYYIQVKYPLADKLKTLLHHSCEGLVQLKQIESDTDSQIVFVLQYSVLKQWIRVWNTITALSAKEWLIHTYISYCLDITQVPDIELIWFTDAQTLVHSDWSILNSKGSYKSLSLTTFITKLKKQIQSLLKTYIYTIPYDSAPWSLHSFIKLFESSSISSLSDVTEHAWWIRQDLSNTKHGRSMSFSLDAPPAFSLNEPKHKDSNISTDTYDSTDTDSPYLQRGTGSLQSGSKSFPVIRGSMLHSPKIKQFENHLSSKRTKTEPSIIHKMIRMSSGFFK